MANQALGKGLGALIKKNPSSAPISQESSSSMPHTPQKVAIERLVPSPLQPRKQFAQGELDELMDSIAQHGIIQPLIVREVSEHLELIAGERRWRAARELGLLEVPVVLREASDRDVLEMALIENIQRKDLDPIEEAQGYVRLAEEFGLKQETIARRVGKSRASVANAMRLLDLESSIQKHLAQGLLTVGHSKVLLALKDSLIQVKAAEQVIASKLSVRDTERLVKRLLSTPVEEKNEEKEDSSEQVALKACANRLSQQLGTEVQVRQGAKRGKIEIHYFGNEDLERLLELLGLEG